MVSNKAVLAVRIVLTLIVVGIFAVSLLTSLNTAPQLPSDLNRDRLPEPWLSILNGLGYPQWLLVWPGFLVYGLAAPVVVGLVIFGWLQKGIGGGFSTGINAAIAGVISYILIPSGFLAGAVAVTVNLMGSFSFLLWAALFFFDLIVATIFGRRSEIAEKTMIGSQAKAEQKLESEIASIEQARAALYSQFVNKRMTVEEFRQKDQELVKKLRSARQREQTIVEQESQ